MSLHDIRIKKLKALLRQWGGPTTLAKKLELSGPSYLSQLVGENRPFTEKTARKFEQQLALPAGWFDHADENNSAPAARVDPNLINKVVLAVTGELDDAGLKLSREKFAEMVALVYDCSVRAGGDVDMTMLRGVIHLLKKG